MEIKETIFGLVPSKSNSYRIVGHTLVKAKPLHEYEAKFYIQCKNRNKLIQGYFEIQVDVYYPNERSDLDGCLKIILDCLQKAKVIKNDNRCTKIVANKFLDKRSPRVELTINEV